MGFLWAIFLASLARRRTLSVALSSGAAQTAAPPLERPQRKERPPILIAEGRPPVEGHAGAALQRN